MKIVAATLLMFSLAPWVRASDAPTQPGQLSYRQDGADLVISLNVTSSGIGHIVIENHQFDGKKNVTLKYCVVQSEEDSSLDRLAFLDIEWRLKGVKMGDVACKVDGQHVTFPRADLKDLRDKLNRLLMKP